jgi:type I restriction enzyme, S subunit
MSQQELELPQGWIKTNVNDICEKSQYGWTTSSEKNGNLKLLRTTDITSGQIDWNLVPFCKDEPKDIEKYLLEDGDVVISRAGSIGFSCLIKKPKKSVFASYLIRFRPLIDTQFFVYFLKSPFYWKQVSEKSNGIALVNINATKLNQITLSLPPLNEQKRIASKIEELFSRIDSTKQSLEHAKLQLEQYRQSLLKSAFEGKLTEEWRKQNNPSLDILFEKIQSNRKSQESKLQKLEPFNDDEPFSIPENWSWTRVGILSNQIQYGTGEKASTKESILPVLRMGNIQDGVLNFKKLKYYPDNWKSREQYILKDGDVLFNRTNSAELVGKSAIYRNFHPPAVFAGYLIRVKILDEIYFPYLLTLYLNSIFGKSYVKSVVTQQVGQANVNGTKLAMMPIPLMSNEEQEQIVSQIEQGFSLIENTTQIVESSLQNLQTMKTSVLKQAFEGKLVPQDPNDEPASVLLERIKVLKRANQQNKGE